MNDIFITPADIQELRGLTLRNSQRLHLFIRKRLTPAEALERGEHKPTLTIAEYCSVTMEPYREIYETLRGEPPQFDPTAAP